MVSFVHYRTLRSFDALLDSCKRRKERCNGGQPCSICTRRRKAAGCSFSDTPARLLRPGYAKARESDRASLNDNTIDADNYQTEVGIDKFLDHGGDDCKDAGTPDEDTGSPESTAPVPRTARLLRDGRGKFMYVGDSASLSFLQSIRRLVASSLGDCEFTTDPMRHSILETVSPYHPQVFPELDPLEIGHQKARYLARKYLTATSGLLDLFDDTFLSGIDVWVSDPCRDSGSSGPLYYHVIAIGAQVEGDQDLAEKYFARGRRLAYLSNIDAPSVLTVQIFILMSAYLLGACRRNGAYMNFGIACRGSMALGLHKSSTHSLFEDAEVKARLGTWKSVRMLDMFFSGTLGRPPATSDLASDSILEKDGPHFHSMDKISQKVLVLCGITERILLDVWEKKAASTRLADAISRRYRDWTADLPAGLQLQDHANRPDSENLEELLTASHIIAFYHCSIILLTRPFLTHQLVKDLNDRNRNANVPTPKSDIRETSTMKTFADACVDSALRNINIAHDLISYAALPKRLPFILDSVCNSSLVLGAAAFADQEKKFPLLGGLDQGLEVLNHFAPHDPHAHRYAEVITYLRMAVNTHIHNRDQEEMQDRIKKVARPFYNVDHPVSETVKNFVPTGPTTEPIETGKAIQSPANFFALDLGPLANYDSQYSNSDGSSYNDPSMLYYELATFQAPEAGFGQMPSYGDNLGSDSFSFPDDAYSFTEQDTSMFDIWNQ